MSGDALLGRVPQQTRAKATVARIQSAAAEILAEDGLAGLNTNAIAERAQVNISTLYRYYPDKYAVLVHLFDEFEARRADFVIERIADLARGVPWRPWVVSVIDGLARMRIEDSSGVALRGAMTSSVELLAHDRASSARVAERLAVAMCERRPALERERAVNVAGLVVEVITVGLDSAFAGPDPDRQRVEELVLMIEAYLQHHLDD